MDQQGIEAFSSEVDGSKPTNVIEKADFTSATESRGKFNHVFNAQG